jgi:hypothetical protein
LHLLANTLTLRAAIRGGVQLAVRSKVLIKHLNEHSP